MDQQDKTPERIEPLDDLICLSTGYNLMSVTISESCFHGTTDICLRVNDREEFDKLEKLMKSISLNMLLILDSEDLDKRQTKNIQWGSGL